MKKIFVTLVAFLTIGIAATIANEEPAIDPKILTAFQKQFSFAKDVKWEVRGEFTQVNFSLNDHGFVAWYNADAKLLSTARNILYMQLPLSVIRSLEKNYNDASFSGIVEITRDGETFYQLRAERKNKKYLLKASQDGTLIVVRRTK